jgi:hypothetical protein
VMSSTAIRIEVVVGAIVVGTLGITATGIDPVDPVDSVDSLDEIVVGVVVGVVGVVGVDVVVVEAVVVDVIVGAAVVVGAAVAVVVGFGSSRQCEMVNTLSLLIQWMPPGHGRCSAPLPVHTWLLPVSGSLNEALPTVLV